MTVRFVYEVEVAQRLAPEGITVTGVAQNVTDACTRALAYAEEHLDLGEEAHVVRLKLIAEIDFHDFAG